MYNKAIVCASLLIALLISCTAFADNISNDAVSFIEETRVPYWTFSHDNMCYEAITDADFRQWQSEKFAPVFSESGSATVYWNQSAGYDTLSEYDFTLHDSAFAEYGRDYTLDLYSSGDDLIIVAHDGMTIFCVQYINTSAPITDCEAYLSDTTSYFYYHRSTNAITSTSYTLTAFYSDGSVTSITCDANTDEILSVTNEAAPDALISFFDLTADQE